MPVTKRAALPVVRHAQHPRRHLRRLRGAGAPVRAATCWRASGLHEGRRVSLWPNLRASTAVFQFERA
ncbi:MAG: hypothetical protein MZW92_13960 [Comamonadaceae bacterium]|nr:hypothetical protein [Comamonadaceae bacterium]